MQYEGEYTFLGKTDLKVSKIALGCGFRGLYEVDDAAKVIEEAIDCGINFIDCADMYKLRSGEFAESALGKAIKGKREKVVITSKYGGEGGGASAINAAKQIEDSLKRIGTDYIDVYFLHAPDGVTPFDDIVSGLDRLKREGKIRYYGFLNNRMKSRNLKLIFRIQGRQRFRQRYAGMSMAEIKQKIDAMNSVLDQALVPQDDLF